MMNLLTLYYIMKRYFLFGVQPGYRAESEIYHFGSGSLRPNNYGSMHWVSSALFSVVCRNPPRIQSELERHAVRFRSVLLLLISVTLRKFSESFFLTVFTVLIFLSRRFFFRPLTISKMKKNYNMNGLPQIQCKNVIGSIFAKILIRSNKLRFTAPPKCFPGVFLRSSILVNVRQVSLTTDQGTKMIPVRNQ